MIGFRPRIRICQARPRLLSQLPDSEGYVVWLEAPYGYGKNVLMSQWAEQLESEGWRVLWLSVQRHDVKTWLVDHGKFECAFGARPTPHHEAIWKTLAWYRGMSMQPTVQATS